MDNQIGFLAKNTHSVIFINSGVGPSQLACNPNEAMYMENPKNFSVTITVGYNGDGYSLFLCLVDQSSYGTLMRPLAMMPQASLQTS